jgi:erythromycin esterase-like protein
MNHSNKILLSEELVNNKTFNQWLPFRSIGAAYADNAIYGTAILPKRSDAMVYIDSTTAIKPIRQ